MELAYQGEILTPSQCGRMDQACAYGPCPVVLHYDGEAVEVEELSVGAPLHLVVADLCASKDTVVILEKLRGCFPHPRSGTEEGVVELLGPINKRVVESALRLIAEGKVEELGKLMGEAQGHFDRLGGAACPEQLTAPILHKVRRRPVYASLGGVHAMTCAPSLLCAPAAGEDGEEGGTWLSVLSWGHAHAGAGSSRAAGARVRREGGRVAGRRVGAVPV